MTLTQLIYFCSLARNGNYSGAAEECHVSEPVIHRAIRTLEKNCGIELLERAGKRVSLTVTGRAIYEYGTQISSLMHMAQQTLLEKKRAIRGSISIGGGTTVLMHLLPEVLATWMSEHPHVRVSVSEGRASLMQQLLLDNRLDLVFGSGTGWAEDLQREQVFTDSLVVISNPNHPFAKSGLVTFAEASKERVILASSPTSTRNEIQEIERQYGVQFMSTVEVERHYTAKTLCRAGVGLAIVPKSLVTEDLANGRLSLLNVEGFPRSRPYFVVYRKAKILTPEMQSLLTAIQNWVQKTRALSASGRGMPPEVAPTHLKQSVRRQARNSLTA